MLLAKRPAALVHPPIWPKLYIFRTQEPCEPRVNIAYTLTFESVLIQALQLVGVHRRLLEGRVQVVLVGLYHLGLVIGVQGGLGGLLVQAASCLGAQLQGATIAQYSDALVAIKAATIEVSINNQRQPQQSHLFIRRKRLQCRELRNCNRESPRS
ncbi:hypothetical protein FGO68_gene4462 [Halteria grandinella]|uniref:Uncharacterized protein n=1 Tax=Halteria grandinella TaxID=5974 RepID=A0A8J8NR83_HALGN|nr:hypothetical protein FGO68_gene4462 [Halteria grandinella]